MADRALELEDIYDYRKVRTAAVSPDGERVAFVVSEADAEADAWHRSLFVAPTDGSRPPRRLTRVPDAGSPKWSPDGSALAFLAARERDLDLRVGGAGDPEDAEDDAESESGRDDDESDAPAQCDEPRTQVWAFDLERGGDARQITEFEEGASGFDWGPAGERLVVAARDPTPDQRKYLDRRRDDGPIETERLQHKFDGEGWLDSVGTYLFVVDRRTREATRLDDAYGGGAMEPRTGLSPAWSPEPADGTAERASNSPEDGESSEARRASSGRSGDGGRIAFLSNRTDRPDDSGAMDVYTISPDGSDLRRLTDGDLLCTDPRWSPDGRRLAVVARSATNWYETSDVLVADPAGGEFEPVSSGLDRGLSDVAWSDEETLLATADDEARARLVRLRVDGPPERVFDRQGEYRTVTDLDAAGDTASLVLSAPNRPPELHALPTDEIDADGESGPARRVSDLNADLREAVELPTCERVTFENGDGDEIEGLAYLPRTFDPEDPTRLPLVVDVHGGPMSYDAPRFGFDETYWTGQGYAVLQVNYRGSTSYGQAFSEQIRGEWGPRESDDIVSGARDLVERGWADPDRLFLTGFSQGGINTVYVLTRTDEFAAAAPEHGIYDFRGLYGTADTQLWYENDLGLPWENPEGYRAISSIPDVDRIETPTLITAGEADWRCPPWQAEQLYVRLRKRGVPSKLVTYPDEHHNIGDPERAVHRLQTLAEWFERHDTAVEE